MEVLAALGYGAKELFSYNRENFKFDQDQRIERESLRLEMQVKRFELFREDVHDLVELTVDRMDVYHLVGALFLEFCIVLFCEGRIQASAPPFLLSLFLLSNACAFIYLLLAVWLSMHASIAAHSFGVRLLTRFVRLPIPSIKQISALKSRLKDYESQGIGNLLRLPGFSDKQEWKQVEEDTAAEKVPVPDVSPAAEVQGDESTEAASSSTGPVRRGPGKRNSLAASEVARGAQGPVRRPSSRGTGGTADARVRAPSPMSPGIRPKTLGKPLEDRRQSPNEAPELLGEEMDFPMGGEDLLSGPRGAQPERHIQLFRQLQAKWQCYDAYCRVCMGLGVNQILQGLSYYCICHTLVENHSPTTGYALVVLFQCTTVALAVLDLAGMKRREIIAVQVVGIMPCLLTAWGVAHGMRDASGVLDPEQKYMLSPLSFLCQVVWLELWLRVAAPSCDQAKLPRRFRQVLFLDVFGDAEGWDPTQTEDEEAPVFDGKVVDGALGTGDDEDRAAEEEVNAAAQQAASQLTLVQCALRRWLAVPDWALSREQRGTLDSLCEQRKSWGNTITTELSRQSALAQEADLTVFENELRRWQDLSEEERSADPFANCLVGGFEHNMGTTTSQYYYDVEGSRTVFEDSIHKTCPGALVLSLDAVAAIMHDLENQTRQLLELRIMRDLRAARRRQARMAQESRDNSQAMRARARLLAHLKSKRCASQKGAFPNLVSLFNQRHQPPQHRRSGRRELDREQGIELLSDSPPASATHTTSAPAVVEAADPAPELQPSPTVAAQQGSGSPPTQDQTLVAMAGQHARHFVPERLPWQVLSRMTRVLQLCWFYSGLMALLKEMQVYQVDYQQHPGHTDRRLCEASPWLFERVDVEWPHGDFFRPQGLTCLPTGELVLASPFALYRANASSRLEEAERLRVAHNAAVICADSCLLASPTADGLLLTSNSQQEQLLGIEGEPWRLVAGAIMPCLQVASLLLEEERDVAERCLLLAGWDGELLPVAAVPLPLATPAHLRPAFDAPLPAADVARGLRALHLEPRKGRLWAVLANGDFLAWDLLELRSLGRWRPQWPFGVHSSFRPMALCEDHERGFVFALGRGPLLARASVPDGAFGSTALVEDSSAVTAVA